MILIVFFVIWLVWFFYNLQRFEQASHEEMEEVTEERECLELCRCSLGNYGPVLPEHIQDFIEAKYFYSRFDANSEDGTDRSCRS
ncbi:hypothetical protein C9J01_17725 [Photobacterium rosenbergii]|uniref:Uncharacterized protein n=1 Tax=Photobacterium rosenbergii TaxID=294936 RepID=A0A2T3NAR9_9GAMM|nr:hypothetical protein C9J01_17725 [Photobacterium rosenbergii]